MGKLANIDLDLVKPPRKLKRGTSLPSIGSYMGRLVPRCQTCCHLFCFTYLQSLIFLDLPCPIWVHNLTIFFWVFQPKKNTWKQGWLPTFPKMREILPQKITGSEVRKVDPFPSWDLTDSSPPCLATTCGWQPTRSLETPFFFGRENLGLMFFSWRCSKKIVSGSFPKKDSKCNLRFLRASCSMWEDAGCLFYRFESFAGKWDTWLGSIH